MKKRKLLIRIVTLLLAMCMTAIAFVGCKRKKGEVTEESNTTTSTGSEGYELPQADLNGFVFNILCRETDLFQKEVWSVDTVGEQISTAIFNRNSLIEERLNCLIGMNPVSESPESTLTNTFNRSVMAGDTDTHLALGHMHHAGQESLQGTMYNWYDIPNIDFENPWWHHSLIDAMTYNRKMYVAASDFCISSVDFTWTMIFNTEMAANNQVDVYSMVKDGTWTLENFNRVVKESYVSNGSGDVDIENDTFGFVTHYDSAVVNWMFSLEIPVSRFTTDGKYELLLNSDRMINATERIYNLLFNGNGTLYVNPETLTALGGGSHDRIVTSKFGAGQALFAAVRIFALDNLRNNDIDYGIVPYPKYDEEQQNYYSHVDGRASLMFVPMNLPTETLENVGTLIEALSYVTYRDVMPEIESVCLLGRYSRDSVAYQMLQQTLAGRSYAFSFVYNTASDGRPYWIMSKLMRGHSSNFSSTWRSVEGVLKRDFDGILEKLK